MVPRQRRSLRRPKVSATAARAPPPPPKKRRKPPRKRTDPRKPQISDPKPTVIVVIPGPEYWTPPASAPRLVGKPKHHPRDPDYNANHTTEEEEEDPDLAKWTEGDEVVVAEAGDAPTVPKAGPEPQAYRPSSDELQKYGPKDVDAWNVTVYPEDLLSIHGRDLTLLRLISRAPYPILRDNKHYKEWVYLAEGIGLLKVEPRFKLPLIRVFQRQLNVQPNSFGLAFSSGCPTVTLQMMVKALREVGCDSVRIQAYGMKLALSEVCTEPGNPEHPLSGTNTWDLGVNYSSPDIWLVAFLHTPRRPNRQFSMLTPIGRGFGGVDMQIDHPEGYRMQLKVYPRLVHAIKAFNSKMAKTEPRYMDTVTQRLTSVRRLVEDLGSVPSTMLGGLRMEVSVPAPTLSEAEKAATRRPYLCLPTFLDARDPWSRSMQLQLYPVRVSAMLGNVRKLHHIASGHTVMAKRKHSEPSELARVITADLLNSIGWNPGIREPTRWNNAFAWWVQQALVPSRELTGPARVTVPEMLELPKLWDSIRAHLPCRDCHAPAPYHSVGGRQRWRLRCSRCNKGPQSQ